MINEPLNKLLELAKGQRSQNEFALHCGVSSSALTRIKNGDYNTTPDFLKKVANRAHNGVTYEQLMIAAGFLTDEKSTHLSYEYLPTDGVVSLKIIGTISAGYNGEAIEEILGEQNFLASSLRGYPPEECFLLQVRGNSMYPDYQDKDIVLVHRQTSVDSGSVAVILYNGNDATLKRVIYKPNEDWLELIPKNPEYPTKRIEGADLQECQVLGKVICIVFAER